MDNHKAIIPYTEEQYKKDNEFCRQTGSPYSSFWSKDCCKDCGKHLLEVVSENLISPPEWIIEQKLTVDVTKWLRKEDAEQLFMGSMPSCILVSQDVWETFFHEDDKAWNQGLMWDLLWMYMAGRNIRDGKYNVSKGEYGVFLTPKGSRKEREVCLVMKSADNGGGLLIERKVMNVRGTKK